MTEVEIWVLVDEHGNAEVSVEAGDLRPKAGLASRLMKVTLKVPTPRPVELEAEAAEEPSAAELTVGEKRTRVGSVPAFPRLLGANRI